MASEQPRSATNGVNLVPGRPISVGAAFVRNHCRSSFVILSSPQVGFSRAIRRIRSRKPRGTAGLRPETSAARTLRIPALADAPSSHDTVTLYNMSDGRPISEFSM